MPRKKKRGRKPKSKSPLAVNNNTFFNIIGLLVLATGILVLISYFVLLQDSNRIGFLAEVNGYIFTYFGWTGVFVPFILILFSGVFFNSERLKFVKFNVTAGLFLIFLTIMSVFSAGSIGRWIFSSLETDLTIFGAYTIYTVIFIIGLLLFFDTTVDVFFVALKDFFKPLFERNAPTNEKKQSKQETNTEPENKQLQQTQKSIPEFISDIRKDEKKPSSSTSPSPVAKEPSTKNPQNIEIKPVSKSSTGTWVYPPVSLLKDIKQTEAKRGDVAKNADTIERTLESFGIRARVAEINKGPTVTQYAIEITMGTKLSKITSLANDLALALAAPTGAVRIEAPIPGRSLVGVEIPNISPQMVTFKQIITSATFTEANDPLLVPLGLNVSGEPEASSISRMPHVLIAGTTGSGKSVTLNAWIATFLCRTRPDELRMIMVDPKRVELALYNGIPHLLTEVIVDPQKILAALQWTVGEMENRYKQFAELGVRNLEGYNNLENVERKPYIVFIIDELADLMMFASKEAEDLITRIAQMARATGIHLILATQRPSVDVITGLMKANIPSRLAFNVSSMVDSRVIIDGPGAEKLLGKGDMLFLPPDQAKPKRLQGAYIDEKEIAAIVGFLKSQVPEVEYTEAITENDVPVGQKGNVALNVNTSSSESDDPLFNQAVDVIGQAEKASASLLQRKLKIGYARAARMLDELEEAGYVGPAEGSKPREVIKRSTAKVTESI